MTSVKKRVTGTVERARERWPVLDHLLATLGHYSSVNGNGQAGASTYFGFLSFFPLLALGFFVVGSISKFYPNAEGDLVTALDDILPGLIGDGEGEIPLARFQDYAGTVGIIGAIAVLYSGLRWLSGMRDALEVMFRQLKREQPNFFVGKALDLFALVVLGTTLVLSVGLSGAVAGLTNYILGWVGFDTESFLPRGVVWLLGHGLALAATTVLLLAMFRLLARPQVPGAALRRGALLGAVGFELLKALANFLIGQTKDQPAFQAFGVALILVVWINYFSRLVMYSASWAYTSPLAIQARADDPLPSALEQDLSPAPIAHDLEGPSQTPERMHPAGVAAVAGAALGAVATWLALRSHRVDD